MQRRSFIKNSALAVVAISASGFISFENDHFVGDCETTTDILGPFYRPNSPVRNILNIKGETGEAIHLQGVVNHNDCKTPYKNAKIELWHCDGKGEYDNSSEEFRYRGTTYTDEKGNYSFKTIMPVQYGSRPAHFHMMISAEGYQSLVTQLYFSGDSNLEKDSSSSSITAKKRILNVKTLRNGGKKVVFNVGMSEILEAEPTAIEKLVGTYIRENDKKETTEIFKSGKALWIKNDVFGDKLQYIGNNTFTIPGMPEKYDIKFHFEILNGSSVRLSVKFTNEKGESETETSLKEK